MAYLKKFLPHLLVLVIFVIVSLIYFSPVLEGKKIFQSDIVHYIGMAKEQNDFRDQTGEEPYWTDSAFGGMPTFQLGAYYPHNYVKKLDSLLRFLPRPADYLFLYFIGFYILMLCIKLDFRLAFLGALAFGFSTYLIIILGVGHNAKAHAIAYMPMVLGGIILTFRQKYLWGFLLLSLAMALQIGANHFQMTYYLLLLVIVLGIAYLVDAYLKNILPKFFKALGVMAGAVFLAVGANATNLLATQEYTSHSTRGDTGLTILPDGSSTPSTGLTFDYITAYSYEKLETFGLFIPRFMGGGSSENLGEDSHVYDALIKLGATAPQASNFVHNVPTYWGEQTYVAGAQLYVGATLIFFFVFAFFLISGRLKWWILGGIILALFLSWGRHFAFLTEMFIDYIPLYNKFRAVSSIQVIFNICIPIMAVVGISKLFSAKIETASKEHALKWTLIITGGLSLFFLLFKTILFDFSGGSDSLIIQQMGMDFMRALKEDRKSFFNSDTIRSLIFVLISSALVWAYIKNKIAQNWLVAAMTLLILADLIPVNKRYVNNDDFVNARQMDRPFQPNRADQKILQDITHFRVFDISADPFNSSRASYFHNAIGGYHAAKPGRIQDLYDFYISQNNMEILNMLNAKYFIIPSEDGQPQAQQNPNAFGNAWFVKDIRWVKSANEEILSLSEVDLQNTAVINSEFKDQVSQDFNIEGNPEITLESYQPNELVYKTDASAQQMVVFSEMYYQPGWQAYIDGNKVDHVRANYVLRAMNIPAGEHRITFKFEPEVINLGSSISLASSIILILIISGGVYLRFRNIDPTI